RKKIWTIVGTFIAASGILYFLFMTVWFNAFQLMGQVIWVQRLLGLGALYLAFVSLRDFWRGKVECEVGNLKSKQKTRKRIQNIIDAPMNIALFFSIVALAFTVNAIEFACSLGLPAIFTGVLAQADLTQLGYYGYIALYDLFYMLDDVVIFSLAAIAVDKFVGDKYVKYCKLGGGIILIFLAALLLIAPEMLR
ncbi:MAG: glutaredoxin family protein, partial [Alphaproteobacteria bacterium]